MTSFGLRLIIGGIPATVIGIIWFVYGFSGGDPHGVFTGGLWKGPLLTCTGIAAVIMGVRMSRDEDKEREE